MAIPPPPRSAAVTPISPECEAWLFPEHIGAQEVVTPARPAPSARSGLDHYQGLCRACLEARQWSPYW
jgi:hypothetical protein